MLYVMPHVKTSAADPGRPEAKPINGPLDGSLDGSLGGSLDGIGQWIVLDRSPGIASPLVEPLRALLNTDDRFHGTDTLDAEAPRALVLIRDALRTLLVDGEAGPLTEIADAHPLRLVVEQGRVHLAPTFGAGPVDALVASVLARLAEAQNAGEWSRLKSCGNPDCQWIFYDTSRNRSGRWCSMQECGDVMKARAYRRRRRALEDGAGPS